MKMFLSTISESKVRIPCMGATLDGDVIMPVGGAKGMVVFVHGSGSSRMSPRNRLVAAALHRRGLATLLFDLLTPKESEAEARTGELRFNIPFLKGRLVDVTQWLKKEPGLKELGVGYFGASTGAAAALAAAAELPDVQAVVSRGGRTDLAGSAARQVTAPTLLLVGGHDTAVIEWNRETLDQLGGKKELVIIGGATHLFPESGALEHVAELAAQWFDTHLSALKPGRAHGWS